MGRQADDEPIYKSTGIGGKEEDEMKSLKHIRWIALVCVAIAAGAAEEGWRLELTPYVWFANVDGSVSVADRKADFDASFSDLVDKVDLGGALIAVGSCGRWVGFAQLDYFSLGQDFDHGAGGSLDSDMLLVSGAAGYRFNGLMKGATIELLGGARYLWNRNEVEVKGLGSDKDTSEIVDAIVMLRPSLPIAFVAEKLRFNLTLSIGAGDSDLVWEVQPELQYQFSDRLAGRVGYRRVQYEFTDGPADVDVGFQGLLVGLGLTL